MSSMAIIGLSKHPVAARHTTYPKRCWPRVWIVPAASSCPCLEQYTAGFHWVAAIQLRVFEGHQEGSHCCQQPFSHCLLKSLFVQLLSRGFVLAQMLAYTTVNASVHASMLCTVLHLPRSLLPNTNASFTICILHQRLEFATSIYRHLVMIWEHL